MKHLITTLLISLFIFPLYLFAEDEHGHEHGKGGHEEAEGEHGHGAEKGGDAHGHGHEEAEPNLALSDESLQRFGIALKEVGPVKIVEGIQVSGRIVPVDAKLAHVSPRFSGVVKEVSAKVGDLVKPGTPLALIQNNQNLQTFVLSPAIPGIVIKRHATLGESVTEESVLFIVADLTEVWVELAVYKQDVDKVRVGQKARVSVASHLEPQDGEVIFFSPVTEERTQSRVARISLRNPDPHFSPGAFVSGIVVTSEVPVPIAVQSDAIQQIEGKETVFVQHDGKFEPHPVVTGRTDGTFTEILKGLEAGEKYASGKTFLLKAELGKSEAEHEH